MEEVSQEVQGEVQKETIEEEEVAQMETDEEQKDNTQEVTTEPSTDVPASTEVPSTNTDNVVVAETDTNVAETEVLKDVKIAESAPQPETSADVVARLEEEFKDRYTEKDAVHTTVMETKDPNPPVISDFGSSRDRDREGRTSSRDDHRDSKRTHSRSRSPVGPPAKREGIYGIHSYFVFYY